MIHSDIVYHMSAYPRLLFPDDIREASVVMIGCGALYGGLLMNKSYMYVCNY